MSLDDGAIGGTGKAGGRPGPRKLALGLDAGGTFEGGTSGGKAAFEDPAGWRARGLTCGGIVEGGTGG